MEGNPRQKSGLGGEVYWLSEGTFGDDNIVDSLQIRPNVLHPELLQHSCNYVNQKAGAVLQDVNKQGL